MVADPTILTPAKHWLQTNATFPSVTFQVPQRLNTPVYAFVPQASRHNHAGKNPTQDLLSMTGNLLSLAFQVPFCRFKKCIFL